MITKSSDFNYIVDLVNRKSILIYIYIFTSVIV